MGRGPASLTNCDSSRPEPATMTEASGAVEAVPARLMAPFVGRVIDRLSVVGSDRRMTEALTLRFNDSFPMGTTAGSR